MVKKIYTQKTGRFQQLRRYIVILCRRFGAA
jgi:hypothetical protein